MPKVSDYDFRTIAVKVSTQDVELLNKMCQKTAQALGGRCGERRETMRGVCCETRAVCTTIDRPIVPTKVIDLGKI